MKSKYKILIFILIGLVISGMILLSLKKSKKQVNRFVSLSKNHEIPFGTSICFQQMKGMFPKAKVFYELKNPMQLLELDKYGKDQLLIIITKNFLPSKEELKFLYEFVSNGNYLFVSSFYFNETFKENFSISDIQFYFNNTNYEYGENTAQFYLQNPQTNANDSFAFPKKGIYNYLYRFSDDAVTILGTGNNFLHNNMPNSRSANFVSKQSGKGVFFIHCQPTAFSNYFLLYNNNIEYFNRVFSLIPSKVNKVIWSEYFLNKMYDEESKQKVKNPGLWRVLWNTPSLKWAVLLSFALLLIYFLLEMKRKFKVIPVIKKPVNDSLDFTKTIGRLYFQKKNHLNLCNKMTIYFLEHIRTKYKINTNILDHQFIQSLSAKSGYGKDAISEIIQFISLFKRTDKISQQQLIKYYQLLESFYKNS